MGVSRLQREKNGGCDFASLVSIFGFRFSCAVLYTIRVLLDSIRKFLGLIRSNPNTESHNGAVGAFVSTHPQSIPP
jgi:hypothetical protein